jgi:nucleoside-diphosphate-sugar epimerase
MKIFITGATGFIGRYLVQSLLLKKHELFILMRKHNDFWDSLQENLLTIIYGDISAIKEIKIENTFDVCFHLAWAGVDRTNVWNSEIHQNNMRWSLDVLNFSIRHGCICFINAGTRQEYAPTFDVITEESLCSPISEYGINKLHFFQEAQDICLNNEIKLINLRIFSLYGIGDHPWSLISNTITSLLKSKDVKLSDCSYQWSFLHIHDLVSAMLTILDIFNIVTNIEVFNLGSEDVRYLRDFVWVIKKNIPYSQGNLLFGAFTQQNKESSFSIMPSMCKLKKYTKWKESVYFEDGIKSIIEHESNK